jgi:hypothetical protein
VQPWEGNHLPKLLRVANIDFALELVSSTEISVHPFLDQHRLDGGVAKDDSCGQETIHDGEADLNYNGLADTTMERYRIHVRIRFHCGTSNAPTVSSSPAASVQVPTGLNESLRSRAGLASRLQISSTDVTRWDKDMSVLRVLYYTLCNPTLAVRSRSQVVPM